MSRTFCFRKYGSQEYLSRHLFQLQFSVNLKLVLRVEILRKVKNILCDIFYVFGGELRNIVYM